MWTSPKTGIHLCQNTNTKVLEAVAQRICNAIVASIGRQDTDSAASLMPGPDKEVSRIIRAHRLLQTVLLEQRFFRRRP